MYTDKVLLITGGTGSFGKTVVQDLLKKDIGELRVFSRDEAKQDFMRSTLNDDRVKYYIGDVRDKNSLSKAMKNVDYVFHAAALKQVPSCEFFPMQAVFTNVIGSENVIDTAVDNGVSKIVCLSTDKAVLPVNAMGMSKALMEKVAQSWARNLKDTGTTVSCTRYGNVMASRGSVIPRFIEQIKAGLAITITEPSMTRFIMALPESVELVQYAFDHAKQGDIFVKKAPACTVENLAQALKNLFNSSVETRIIGMRHGEKIYETLVSQEEMSRAEDMGDFYRVSMDSRDLNYEKYFNEGNKEEVTIDDYHSHNTTQLSVSEVEAVLLKLPEVQEELK